MAVLIIDTALLLTHKANKKLIALGCTEFKPPQTPDTIGTWDAIATKAYKAAQVTDLDIS